MRHLFMAAICCFVLIHTNNVNAGMSLPDGGPRVVEMEVEIVSWEELNADNVSRVSYYTRNPIRKNWPDGYVEWTTSALESFVSKNAGYVMAGVIRKNRIADYDAETTYKDKGWIDSSDVQLKDFYISKSNISSGVEVAKFEKGALIRVMPISKDGCDTVPPEGECAFDLPVSIVHTENFSSQ